MKRLCLIASLSACAGSELSLDMSINSQESIIATDYVRLGSNGLPIASMTGCWLYVPASTYSYRYSLQNEIDQAWSMESGVTVQWSDSGSCVDSLDANGHQIYAPDGSLYKNCCSGGEDLWLKMYQCHTPGSGTPVCNNYAGFTLGLGDTAREIDLYENLEKINYTTTALDHEFGHVLGYEHEDLRTHTDICGGYIDSDTLESPSATIGSYDAVSIMNYDCLNSQRRLSAKDINGVQRTYGLNRPFSTVNHASTAMVVLRQNASGALKYYARSVTGNTRSTTFIDTPDGMDAGGAPVITWSANGNVDVFARRNDGNLGHRSQVSGVWTSWETITVPNGGLRGDPVVTSRRNGEFTVVARTDDDSFGFIEYYGGAWKSWTSISGRFVGAPSVAMFPTSLVATDVYVFVVSSDTPSSSTPGITDHKLRYFTIGDGSGSHSVSALQDLAGTDVVGGSLAAVNVQTSKLAGTCNNLYVFAKQNGGLTYRKKSDGSSGCISSTWTSWTTAPYPTHWNGGVVATSRALNTIDLFLRDPSGDVYTVWGSTTSLTLAKLTGTSGQTSVTDKVTGSVAASADGTNASVFARTTDGEELHLWWDGTWHSEILGSLGLIF